MKTVIKIIEIININLFNVKFVNSEIATAIPLLALFIANKVMKLPIRFTEFIELFKIRKSLDSIFLIKEETRTEVWEEPRPGRKAEKIPAIDPRKTNLNFLNSIFRFCSICSGILELFFILKIKELRPNNPESRGNKGSFVFGKFKVMKPNVPAKRNIVNVRNLCFSLKINIIERRIKIICI